MNPLESQRRRHRRIRRLEIAFELAILGGLIVWGIL